MTIFNDFEFENNRRLMRRLFTAVALIALWPCTVWAQVGNNNPTGPSGFFNGEVTTAGEYDPFTGNAVRSSTDLVVAGSVGSYPLAFTRRANSRYAQSSGLGEGGGWQHSYAWSVDGSETNTSGPSFPPAVYPVSFPDGRVVNFAFSASDAYFRGPPGVRERFQPTNFNTMLSYLILPDGGKVEFKATRISECDYELHPPCTYSYTYRAQAIIDPYGLRTTFSYNIDGTLNTVQEPGARWIQLFYTTIFDKQVIDYIKGSDLREVHYTYESQIFGSGSVAYLVLINAKPFGDDSLMATYTYTAPNVGSPDGYPLLKSCDDPMYSGPMKKLFYSYATINSDVGTPAVAGQILSENYSDAGPVVSTLDVIVQGRAETKVNNANRYFTFDGGGKIASASDYYFHFSAKQYDQVTGFPNGLIDRNGVKTDIECNSLSGNTTKVTFPATPNDTLAGTPRGTVVSTFGSATCPDPNNRDPNNPYYLYSVKDEAGNLTRFTRTANKRVSRIDYANAGYETFTYNTLGQVLTHRLTSSGTEKFEYAGNLLQKYRDPYHASGNPTYLYGYDAYGRLHMVTDYATNGSAQTTTYDYDGPRGLLEKVTHPDTTFTQVKHNPDGTLAWAADESHPDAGSNPDSRTTYAYDDYKRVRYVTTPLRAPGDTTPRTTSYFYDSTGIGEDYTRTEANATWVVSPGPEQRKVAVTYDNNVRKMSVTQAAGSVDEALTTYSYDIVGNLKDVLAPNQQAGGPNEGTKTTYFYDERNRLSDIDDPIPTNRNTRSHTVSLIYSEGGNKIQHIRANNEFSQWHYDAMNRIDQTTGFGGETTGYGHDLAGNVLSVTDAKLHIYKYTYDLLNRRITSTYPKDAANSARGEIWRYNTANDLDRYTNTAAQVKTLTYDNRHRLTNSSWSNSSAPAGRADYYGNSQPHNVWTLDPAGTPITTVTFQYDGANNLISENQTVAGQSTHYVVPGWDADGNRNNLAVTTNGITDINFHYDYTKRNQLSVISANGGSFPLEGYYYDRNGNVTRREGRWFWAGTNYFYDALNRVTKCEQTGKDGSNTPYATSQQIYDSVNRAIGTWRDEQATLGDGFGYNARDQLTGVLYNATQVWTGNPQNPSRTVAYNVDPLNRTSVVDNGVTTGYTASMLNQYLTAGTRSFTYDTNFNLKTATNPGLTASYDAEKHLTSMTAGSTGQFVYDGLGRCVKRTINGASRHFAYDGWHPVVEYDGAGNYAAFNVYGAGTDEIVMRHDVSVGYTAYSLDWQGNVFTIMDGAAQIVERYKYDAFGQPTISDWDGGNQRTSSNQGNRFMFTGREYLPELGIYDYRHRFYHPGLGRFLQSDPIGFGGGDANLFRYCGGNPVNGSDPSGLINWTTVGRGTLTTIGGVGTMVGGAIIAGATWETVAGAWFGGVAMFAGATSTGLGITTIADGFRDTSGSPANIPQGPLALGGQMTGNPALQDFGDQLDVATGFLLPPTWGGPLGLANTLLFSPPPPPNITRAGNPFSGHISLQLGGGGGENHISNDSGNFSAFSPGPNSFTNANGDSLFAGFGPGGFWVIGSNWASYAGPVAGGGGPPKYEKIYIQR